MDTVPGKPDVGKAGSVIAVIQVGQESAWFGTDLVGKTGTDNPEKKKGLAISC